MRRHPTADELAAAALPGEQAEPATYEHLHQCMQCAADLEGLRATVRRARQAMMTPEEAYEPPPPSAWRAVVAELGDELVVTSAGATVHEVSAPQDADTSRTRRRRALIVVPAALLAACAAAVALILGTQSQPQVPARNLALVSSAPGVGGSVVMTANGSRTTMRIELTVPGGPPTGHELEVHLQANGVVQPVGALKPTDGGELYSGSFDLPAAPDDVTVDIAVEPLDGDPDPTGASLAHTV